MNEVSKKGYKLYCVETLQNHTDTQLPGQEDFNEHGDTFWKALLSLHSGRQGHFSGVGPSTKRQPQLPVEPGTSGAEMAEDWSPLRLAHLRWVGWKHRREALHNPRALQRSLGLGEGKVHLRAAVLRTRDGSV